MCLMRPTPASCGCACACCCRNYGVRGLGDPEDQGGIPPIIDPEDQGGIPPIIDPEDQGGIPPIIDPEDQGGIPPIIDPSRPGCGRHGHCGCRCGSGPPSCGGAGLGDPEDQGGIPPIIDPEDQGGIPPIIDPEDQGGIPPIIDPGHPSRRALCGGRGAGRPGAGRGAYIVVRMAPELETRTSGTLYDLAKRLGLDGLLDLLKEFEVRKCSRPMVSAKHARRLEQWETCAARGPLPPLRSLASYWRLDIRRRTSDAVEIVRRLNALDEVDRAYREIAATDPAHGAFDEDPFAGFQGYLDPAPVGIDARFARHHTTGESVGFADLEQGWMLHEEFGDPAGMLGHGDNRHGAGSYVGNHGTAVLGEVMASKRKVGVVGIASGIASVKLLSHYRQSLETNGWIADAILAAVDQLAAGDVLLLEVQRGFLPTEIDDADFDAIRLAVSHGIVVVEAAGNGGANLDALRVPWAGSLFNRCSCDFLDSGAILVGGALSVLPHDRKPASNYGSRIDCYAWADNVASCGYGDLQAGGGTHESYTATFSNTSAASPIIAGAAILVQSRYRKMTGASLTPLQMRAVLRAPATGTRQGPNVPGHIGVMPDLRAIFHRLSLVPRPFLRSHVGDPGDGRRFAFACASPDLVLTPEGDRERDACRVLLSMCNRGRGQAAGVAATVYACPPATMPSPDLWRQIGTTEAPKVHQGGSPCPAEPIDWADGPEPGKPVCLVAHLHAEGRNGRDDGERPGTWRDYLVARGTGRLAVNNVHAVEPSGQSDRELEFLVVGPPRGDRPRTFSFEVVQRLPEGVFLSLELPPLVRNQLQQPVCSDGCIDETLRVPPLPRVVYRDVRLGAGARHRAILRISGLAGCEMPDGSEVAIRQIWAGIEVGRITWRFGSAS